MRKKTRKRPIRPPRETDEQAVLVDYLRLRGLEVFSVPNGAMLGGRNKWGLLAKLRREGMLPGAPDLVLIQRAPATGRPVCIEMKRRKTGKVSKNQETVLPLFERAGWHVIVARGAQDALDSLAQLGY
jgi:hypothetical protein